LSVRTKKAKPAAKKKQTATEAPKVEKPKVTKPSGRVPGAAVTVRHGSPMLGRRGKGFSRRELSEGGLPLGLALKWLVPVDLRRRSMTDANVSAIRKWYAQAKKPKREMPPKQPRAAPRKRVAKKKEA
jgi:ribosomal protein L13E